ncbi:hypothetical protein L6164_026091 [Bauhinia variegata]|uniref:Uncharacterized protein n=1 Tax=Bauhinia variegata TaxID=167791 RepID=A0ACB9M4L1_BAUVA|nr:hypothetical protein L6164_026091 [Bauhinia variegata]
MKKYKKNSRPKLNIEAEFKPQKMAALNRTFKICRAQSKPKRKGLHKHDPPQTKILTDPNTSCADKINVPADPFSLNSSICTIFKTITEIKKKILNQRLDYHHNPRSRLK